MRLINRLSTGAFVFCVAITALFSAVDVNAQGRYAARYSKRDVSGIISKVEQSSNTFRSNFDRAMDRSNLNGTREEDRYNNLVRDFENSADRLRREFDRSDSWWQSRNNVESLVRDAMPVNTMMTTISFRRNIERQWNQLRKDINTLADTYDLAGLNGGGWNGGGGGWNGGGGGGNAPTWAVGTFYARNPQTGGKITMVVSRNGSVSLSYDDGTPTYASMNGTTLTNGPYVSRVSRLNNGIRTTSTTNNEFIDYFNTWNGGGWNGGGNNGGGNNGGGNVPSWALGTFYARNPQTGGRITMTIDRNGSVTLSYDGNNTSYATLNGTLLTNGPYTSRVSRIRNGIRTSSTTNSDVIDYFRTQ